MIYTSYWGNLKNLIEVFGRDKIINISRFNSFWNGKKCSMLYPSEDLLKGYKSGKISKYEYEEIYMKYLDSLNVDNCYKVFNGCVFVCYEKEGFCHRHLIEKWLVRNGYECMEFDNSMEIDNDNEVDSSVEINDSVEINSDNEVDSSVEINDSVEINSDNEIDSSVEINDSVEINSDNKIDSSVEINDKFIVSEISLFENLGFS